MRLLQRDLRTIYFRNIVGTRPILDDNGFETSEFEEVLTEITPLRCSVEHVTGKDHYQTFQILGLIQSYERVLLIDDVTLPIDESTRFYIDVPPTETYDYIPRKVVRTPNYISVLVRKVDKT